MLAPRGGAYIIYPILSEPCVVLLQRALRLRIAARIPKKQPIAVSAHIAADTAISLIVCTYPPGLFLFVAHG